MTFLKKYYPHFLIGALAGGINGLLGAGGGIPVTYFLSAKLSSEEKKENGVFANAVATMLPLSVISFAIYLIKGSFKLDASLLSIIPSAIIGGCLGAFLLTRLHLKTVKIIFSLLVTLSGIMMILK